MQSPKKTIYRLLLIFVIFLSGCTAPEQDGFLLSNLHAGAGTPLYTTYAAAMERSEFVLDEAYEFHFYNSQEGIDFTTDTGGDICIGFIIDGRWYYKLEDMYKAPAITVSYPDMVGYHYFPVEGLRADITFLVKSSHTAVMDISLKNTLSEPLNFDVVLLIRNDYRAFDDVEKLNDSVFYFTHQEYPDSWTTGHNVPYADSIKNILMLSGRAGEMAAFNSISGESPVIPFYVFPEKEREFQVTGRSKFETGERNLTPTPQTRLQVFKGQDYTRLITENSPVWKDMQASINRDGYFRVELGNLGSVENGNRYHFKMYYEPENLLGETEIVITNIPDSKSMRKDVELKRHPALPVPSNVKIARTGSNVLLTWDATSVSQVFGVYRRAYPGEATYTLRGRVSETSFTDAGLEENDMYGYVVCAIDNKSGTTGMHAGEVTTLEISEFDSYLAESDSFAGIKDFSKIVTMKKHVRMEPGKSENLRLVRTVGRKTAAESELINEAKTAMNENLNSYLEQNEQLFSQATVPAFENPDLEYLYLSSFNMMRQVFYPPEAKSAYNYYVFSREPTWGWGHGGQVFHESLTMTAYALLDPESAMNSQRVFSERQYENGYINYRTGAYLDEIIEFNGELTSSAPWYNFQNLELYQITGDRKFLEEMYDSGSKFYEFYVSNRDKDGDGLCEWGGHAVLESVRDALVAVWDEVGWPANFEALDLNCMLVMEAKALEAMAIELGRKEEAGNWRSDWEQRTRLINETFWDAETGFYYHVDKQDHDFSFKTTNDLKRQEIIGFLPLWAGVADAKQAEILIKKLTDPDKFWRRFGIPSLAADDPYYNDKGYWNGPVWVEWNYLIVQGLLQYGYKEEAKELTDRVAAGMIVQLKKNHNLWEFYSPDDKWAGYHKTYIWAGIINRMLWEVYR